MTKSNRTARSALIIIVLTLGSRFLGFIREALIAAKFGSSSESDTFFVAIAISSLITTLIMNAIVTTFIPVLSEVETKEGKIGKIRHANNMINILIVLSSVLIALVYIFTPAIVRITAKGFEGEQFNLTVKMTRIGLPMIVFSGILGSLKGFLQSEQKFTSSASIGFPYNLVYILYLLLLSSVFGIKGLIVAAVIAVGAQIIILIPEARKTGYRYKFIFDIKDKYIKKVLYLSVPVLIGVAINDIGVIIDKTLASDLATGSISALNYANTLNEVVKGVFVSAIATVIFPLLAKESNSGSLNSMKKIMGSGVNLILLITIPATVGLIVLAQPIVGVIFQRGAFTTNDTIMTTQALVFYSIGLAASSLRLLITRVYYSLQDTRTPMINGAFAVGIDIVFNIILVRYMAHAGLALATSIGNTVATLILFYSLKKKIGSLGTLGYIKCGLKSGLASVAMGVAAYFTYNFLYGILGISKIYNLISLVVAISVGIAIYGALCYLLGIDEIKDLVGKVMKKIGLTKCN